MINEADLTAAIKREALLLGFHKVGIAPAGRARSGDLLETWLRRGYHASMAWMENAKRTDPGQLLDGAQSVIVVALNYFTASKHLPDTGKISRYAWGDDYHDIVKERLGLLLKAIHEVEPAVRGKLCVDTSPIMEKYWAVEAGIGWQGKHSNVISRDYGSWIFLGELIVDVVLMYDRPMRDFCGTCTRCIDACPTDAIVAPRVVDSAKCISYVTIENRDDVIPHPISTQLENWIYGCDICQDVCPWNEKFSQITQIQEFEPRSNLLNQPLPVLAGVSEEAFSTSFKKSPIKRVKWKGFMRNIRAALGLSRNSQ